MKDAWTEALQQCVAGESENIPNGFLTADQIKAKHWPKLASKTVRDRLGVMMSAGAVERRVFRIFNGKSLRQVPHYKLSIKTFKPRKPHK